MYTNFVLSEPTAFPFVFLLSILRFRVQQALVKGSLQPSSLHDVHPANDEHLAGS